MSLVQHSYLRNTAFIILVSYLFISCKKENIEAGIVTRVYGQVTTDLGTPADSIIVYITGYKKTKELGGVGLFSSLKAHETPAEVMTDLHGNFDFTFTTSGRSSQYSVGFQPSRDLTPKYMIPEKDKFKIENIGKEFLANYDLVITLHPCDITFDVREIRHFPLTLSHTNAYYYPKKIEPITDTNSVTRRIYLERNKYTSLSISRQLSDSVRQFASYRFNPEKAPTTREITILETDFK